MPIAWDDGPKPSSGPVPIFNTPMRSFLRALGDPVGVFVHWAFGRTVPCLGGACAHCRGGQPSRWAGYVPALRYVPQSDTARQQWVPVIWYIPEACRGDLGDGPIRGNIYDAVRAQGRGDRKPLVITLKERPPQEPAAAEFDVRDHLARMWRYAEPAAPPVSAETPDVNGDEPPALPFPGRKPATTTTSRRPRRKGGA